MNRLVMLVLSVCVVFVMEAHSATGDPLKVKRSSALNLHFFQESINSASPRQRRSAVEKRSHVIFDNRSKTQVQLYYRYIKNGKRTPFGGPIAPGKTSRVDTFNDDEWSASVYGDSDKPLLINGKQTLLHEANTKETTAISVISSPGQETSNIEKYVETLVVVDPSVIKRHKTDEDVERYVNVLMNLTTQVYQHNTLTRHGIKVHIIASKVVLLKDNLKFNSDGGEENLYTACEQMNEIADSRNMKFDHKLFITRNGFGAGGFARKYSMCSHYSSCSMVFDSGFSTAFMIAHEIGHSFGLEHGPFEQFSRYLMAGLVDAHFNEHRWSAHSAITLLRKLRKYDCLDNKASKDERYNDDSRHPGEFYSLEKQCQLEYDEGYGEYKSFTKKDPCTIRRCRMPGKYKGFYKTTGSSPLTGTKCGENKWCISSVCRDKTPPKRKTQAMSEEGSVKQRLG